MAITVKCSCGRSVLIRAISAQGCAICPVCGISLVVKPPVPELKNPVKNTGEKSHPPRLQEASKATPPPLPLPAAGPTSAVGHTKSRKALAVSWDRVPLPFIFVGLGLTMLGILAFSMSISNRASRRGQQVSARSVEAAPTLSEQGEIGRSADQETASGLEEASKATAPGPQETVTAMREAANTRKPAADELESRTLTTREVVERSGASVALVKGNHGSGSGFIAAAGLVATNAHVIQNEVMSNIEVCFPSAKEPSRGPYRATLSYENARRDLAILKVTTSLPSLSVSNDYHFRSGEEITIIGNPGVRFLGTVIPNAVSRGIFSAEVTWKGLRFYQLGASVNHGNSGGPVFDSAGKVIGIVTLKGEEEAMGFCVPAEDLVTALASVRVASPEEVAADGKKHDTVAVFLLLREVAGIYSEALEAYVSRMDSSVMAGKSPNEGLEEVAVLITRALRQKEMESTGNLGAELSDLVRDRSLPTETRSGLRELWTTYSDMKSYVQNPRGTYQSFRAKTIELKDRYHHLVKDLELSFGIEPGD